MGRTKSSCSLRPDPVRVWLTAGAFASLFFFHFEKMFRPQKNCKYGTENTCIHFAIHQSLVFCIRIPTLATHTYKCTRVFAELSRNQLQTSCHFTRMQTFVRTRHSPTEPQCRLSHSRNFTARIHFSPFVPIMPFVAIFGVVVVVIQRPRTEFSCHTSQTLDSLNLELSLIVFFLSFRVLIFSRVQPVLQYVLNMDFCSYSLITTPVSNLFGKNVTQTCIFFSASYLKAPSVILPHYW